MTVRQDTAADGRHQPFVAIGMNGFGEKTATVAAPASSAVGRAVRLFLVRHGETAWTLTGQHTSRTDLALTVHGEDEARELIRQLQPIRFTRVLVSPRLRAKQTCELAGLGSASEIEPDLAEWDYGNYEGQRTVDISKTRPGWNVWHDGCPGGENTADVEIRIDRLITRLAAMHGNVALFSHGQLGAGLAARWIGLSIAEGQHFVLHPASLSILGHESRRASVRVIELWNAMTRSHSAKPLQELCDHGPKEIDGAAINLALVMS